MTSTTQSPRQKRTTKSSVRSTGAGRRRRPSTAYFRRRVTLVPAAASTGYQHGHYGIPPVSPKSHLAHRLQLPDVRRRLNLGGEAQASAASGHSSFDIRRGVTSAQEGAAPAWIAQLIDALHAHPQLAAPAYPAQVSSAATAPTADLASHLEKIYVTSAAVSSRDKREIQFLLRVAQYADLFLPQDRQLVRDRLQLFIVVATHGWATAIAHDHLSSLAHLGIHVQPVRASYQDSQRGSPPRGNRQKGQGGRHQVSRQEPRKEDSNQGQG
jgi:hypothetical protein